MYEERVATKTIRQRWDYRCEKVESEKQLEELLNAAGEDCWELVNLIQSGAETTAIYKRPRNLVSGKREPDNVASMPASPKPR